MNEIKAMILFQSVSCVCTFIFSFGTNTTWFALWAIPNAIVQAGTWPALSKLIYTMYVLNSATRAHFHPKN